MDLLEQRLQDLEAEIDGLRQKIKEIAALQQKVLANVLEIEADLEADLEGD